MINKILFSILAVTFAVAGLGSIAGCNTVEGIGADIQQGGHELREEENEHRR